MKYLDYVTQRHKTLMTLAEEHALERDQFQELDLLDGGYQLNFFTISSYLENELGKKISIFSITNGLYKRLGVSMDHIHKKTKNQVIDAVEDLVTEMSSSWKCVIKF